jgi:uncharacterized membrane protein
MGTTDMTANPIASQKWSPAANWAVFSALVFTMVGMMLGEAFISNSWDAFNPSQNLLWSYDLGMVMVLLALGGFCAWKAWRLSRTDMGGPR